MKSCNPRIIKLVLPFALAAASLQGCANSLANQREAAAREVALHAIHKCIVDFAVENNSPRLTGYELVDAAQAGCVAQITAFHDLTNEQGYDDRDFRHLVNPTLIVSKNDALAALALLSHKAAGKPAAASSL